MSRARFSPLHLPGIISPSLASPRLESHAGANFVGYLELERRDRMMKVAATRAARSILSARTEQPRVATNIG